MDEAVLPIARRCRSCVALSSRSRRSLSSSCCGRRRDVRVTPGRSGRRCVRARRRLGAAKPLKPKAPPRPVAADPSLPNDPLWRDSWSLTKVRAPAAWKVTRGAAEVVVAVLDTGVDRSHPDLQGALVEGWDAVNEDADANDDHGHGTLVAGVVAARSNNGIGGVGACSRCS